MCVCVCVCVCVCSLQYLSHGQNVTELFIMWSTDLK